LWNPWAWKPKRFERLDYGNVVTKIGDGYHRWPDKAPFYAIMVTAAVDLEIPPALTLLTNWPKEDA